MAKRKRSKEYQKIRTFETLDGKDIEIGIVEDGDIVEIRFITEGASHSIGKEEAFYLAEILKLAVGVLNR